jgi:hypothetical protein
MKNIFYGIRSTLKNLPNNQIDIKNTKNLPDLIKPRNDIIKKTKESVDPIDKILEKEDPLKLRINIENPDYIHEYYKSLTLFEKLRNNTNKFLLFLGIIKKKHLYINNERRISSLNMKPQFSYIMDPKRSFLKNYQIYFISAVMFFILGYVWARLRYDVYFRRVGFTIFSSFMLKFEEFDSHIKKIEDKLEYYFPRNMTESEYEYLFYKYIQDYKEKQLLSRKIKKYAYIDEDVFDLDKVLGNIRV